MAVEPLFVADMDTLKTVLRLEAAKAVGAGAEFDQAVQEVRLGFYDRLGTTRVAELVAIDYEENPETEDELMRALANSVEIKWVRSALLRIKPMLFLDASGIRDQRWNDEGAFASASPRAIQEELDRLHNEIQSGLDQLAGYVEQETNFVVDVIGPEGEADLPGATIFPDMRADVD